MPTSLSEMSRTNEIIKPPSPLVPQEAKLSSRLKAACQTAADRVAESRAKRGIAIRPKKPR